MTPERYAKLHEFHKCGAHAVATMADVDGLRAKIDGLLEDLADYEKIKHQVGLMETSITAYREMVKCLNENCGKLKNELEQYRPEHE